MTTGTRVTVALEAMPLCADLSAAHLSTLAGLVRQRQVPAGTTLMLMEDQGEVAYLIARDGQGLRGTGRRLRGDPGPARGGRGRG